VSTASGALAVGEEPLGNDEMEIILGEWAFPMDVGLVRAKALRGLTELEPSILFHRSNVMEFRYRRWRAMTACNRGSNPSLSNLH
jgi:hypothetical protein